MSNNDHRSIILRRKVKEHSERRRSVAFLLVMMCDNSGLDPDPYHSAAVIVFDLDGATPSLSLQPERAIPQPSGDPLVYIGGGSRFLCSAVDAVSGGPIAGRDVSFSLTGQGSLSTIDADPQTDEDGDIFCTLTAPTDDVHAGSTATVGITVGDGEEV